MRGGLPPVTLHWWDGAKDGIPYDRKHVGRTGVCRKREFRNLPPVIEETEREYGLAKALFSASFPGEKEKALFQKVIGQTIQWRGTLKSVYPYSTDFVFGKGPGAKAVFEICEIASSYGMKNKIKATVSFREEAMTVLKGQTGKEFSFTGVLLKMEGFSREILVEKGSLTE